MTTPELSTEELIFKAAQQVFIEKGFNGARMQEIADVAGINKALLHYYFRTKEKLFNAIFEKVLSHMLPKVLDILIIKSSLKEKVTVFVNTYIDFLSENPFLPMFILNELNRDTKGFTEVLSKEIQQANAFQAFADLLEIEIKNGSIRPIDPRMLFVNMLSLCIFPFAAKPVLVDVFFKNDPIMYEDFMNNRKKAVIEFVLNAILIEK